MNGADEPLGSPQVTVDELLQIHARLAGDIVEINETTWAIHGVIAVDGDVLIAEFNRPEDARVALEHIAAVEMAVLLRRGTANASAPASGASRRRGAVPKQGDERSQVQVRKPSD